MGKNIGVNDQMDANNKESKISSSDLLRKYGKTGTYLVNGIITEEYNKDLSGFVGITNYDKMRKSDAQVAASLLVCELPIKSAHWHVDAAENDEGEVTDEADEIAQFVENALFEKMNITWDSFLTEALTMLQFGHSVFEKVYTSDGNNIWIKKLGFRKQNSITRWSDLNDNPGITQLLPEAIKDPDSPNNGKQEVFIPAAKLLIFTNSKQGDNYEGISVLRSAYKHRYFKDKLYKFDAVRHERQSVGIPVIYMPSGASDDDKAAALDLVMNVRASEQSGIVIPGPKDDGWLFEFADIKGSDGTNIFESINHHNREISKNVLAQFLELGNTESGSRALGDSQTSLFLQSLEAVAKNIADTINRYLIPELVDLNFNNIEKYPKLKFKRMSAVDYNQLASSLASLSEKGIITPDDDLEQFMRNALDLPKKIKQEKIEEEKQVEKGEITEEDEDQTDIQDEIITKESKQKIEGLKTGYNESCSHDDFDNDYMIFSSMINNRLILDLQKQVSSKEEIDDLKKKGFKFNAFEREAVRPLTFAERKVNLVGLSRSMDSFEEKLFEMFDEISKKQKDDIIKQVKKAVESNDIEAVGAISIKYKGELSKALTDIQKEMFEVGKKSAATEMSVSIPATSKEIRGAMRVQNDAIIDQITNQMETEAKTAVSTIVNQKGGSITEAGVTETIAAVSAGLDKKIQQAKANLTSIGITGAVNLGRTTIFERYPEKIYAMQYSAILDRRTTNICRSLDGRVVKPGSTEFYAYTPPRHYNCRSIWVEILVDEVFKPEITGIPSSIPAAKTLSTAQEMKSPIILKNSPAIKIIKQEIKERQTKLQALKDAGQYPNRQKQHEQKIKELQKSIDGKFTELIKTVLNDEKIYFKE